LHRVPDRPTFPNFGGQREPKDSMVTLARQQTSLQTWEQHEPLAGNRLRHVSHRPVHWAYRAYHPFMYRFPAVLNHYASSLNGRSNIDCSLMILRHTITGW